MKKFLALILSLMLLCSCQSGPDAAQVGEALCKLYVHADSTVSAILENWDTEKIKSTIESDLYDQLMTNLEAVGAEDLAPERLQEVTDAWLKARKRIPLEVELLDSDKEQATVKFTVGSLNLSAIDSAAAEAALAEVNALADTGDYRKILVETYIEELLKGFAEADPTEESTSFEVNFSKENGIWLPEDLSGFVEKLGKSIRR